MYGLFIVVVSPLLVRFLRPHPTFKLAIIDLVAIRLAKGDDFQHAIFDKINLFSLQCYFIVTLLTFIVLLDPANTRIFKTLEL